MVRTNLVAGVLSILVLLPGSDVYAENKCGDGEGKVNTAIIWRGEEPELSLPDIVGLAAPILWYSYDEPLLLKGEFPFPHPHPCDTPSDTSVVYYQVIRIILRGHDEVTIPEQDDTDFFRKVENFTVRYYFYYREDVGMNPHTHDLEVTEFEIALDQMDDGCWHVRIVRVTSFAHGTDWYSNELIGAEDMKIPVTLFVEEGKHATCPDRNADGVYTPGYDVNVRINDAWGVRDIFASGWLISPGFSASMFKARRPEYRVFPPDSPHRQIVHPFVSSDSDKPPGAAHYELRPANTIIMCDDVPPHRDFLLDMMTRHRFGAGNEPEQYASGSVRALAEPLKGTTGIIPSINLRWDRALGLSFALRGRAIESQYIVPRATWIFKGDQWSFELLWSNSASRFVSPYLSSGAGWEKVVFRDDQGNVITSADKEWNWVTEAGMKFRAQVTGKWKILTLGHSFAGVRLGFRFSGIDVISNGRIIAEIGAGVW